MFPSFSEDQQSGSPLLAALVASLAGLAAGLVTFFAPAGLLAQLLLASGLPAMIPAAAPPLGLTMRLGLSIGAAFVTIAVVFLPFRWLGRVRARRAALEEEALDPPRLRRRDLHPDAPEPPLILAVHELGEPEFDGSDSDPLESWDSPPLLLADKPEPWPAPEIEHEVQPTEPEPEPPTQALPIASVSLPLRRLEEIGPRFEWAATRVRRASAKASLEELVERLENALAVNRVTPAAGIAPAPPIAPVDPITPAPDMSDSGDDRLQNAIERLRRVASGQN